jgi:4-amino-4-deoxy-L-arabinose transferase-like glycosyltransferase
MQDAGHSVSPPSARRLPRPPRALVALLGIVLCVGLCWALIVPPWQAPDEISHYGYVESLATSFRLPGGGRRPSESTDQNRADLATGASRGAFFPATSPPSWSRSDYRNYLRANSRSEADRSDGGGASTASGNPPLYYLVAAAGYLVDGGGTAFGRLYAIRLEGVVLLLLTALGAWLLAGETFGRRRLPQLVTAATATLLPMSSFISTDVTPDALMITEWTFALWLGSRVINRAARTADVAALCAITAAAILTKSSSYAFVPGLLLAVALGLARRPAGQRLPRIPALTGCGAVLAAPVVAWLAVSRSVGGTAISQVYTAGRPFNVRQFLSYVWQFYLPRLPFMIRFRLTPQLPLNQIWIDQGAGSFGWLDVSLPTWAYNVAKVALGVLTVSSVWFVARLRGLRRLGLLGFYLLSLLALLAVLHVTEYRQTLGGGTTFLQGRYLLPAVSLLGLAVALLVTRLPRPTRAPAAGLVMVGLLGGQAISLVAIVQAYYL